MKSLISCDTGIVYSNVSNQIRTLHELAVCSQDYADRIVISHDIDTNT